MNGISMDVFRSIANSTTIGDDDRLVLGNKAGTELVSGGPGHEIKAGASVDESRYMRSQLLMRAGLTLGRNEELFGKIQDMLFGAAGKGPGEAIADKPLSKREIAAVIKLTDEAHAGTASYSSPKWDTGVPELKSGVVLRQSALSNTCFACSVLNGIANSPRLAAHFESLVDRTKTPPTIRLYTPVGRKEFRLDEQFGLSKDALASIARKNVTEFEKFFMRYLARTNSDYRPGAIYSDDIVASALGLVRVKLGHLVDDPRPGSADKPSDGGSTVTWSELVDHLNNGGCVTHNVPNRHFMAVVAADKDHCVVADSSFGSAGRTGKAKALEWPEDVTLSFYDLPSEDNQLAFKGQLEKLTAEDLMKAVEAQREKLNSGVSFAVSSFTKDNDYRSLGLKTAREFFEYFRGNPPKNPKKLEDAKEFGRKCQAYFACRKLIEELKSPDGGQKRLADFKAAYEKFHMECPAGRDHFHGYFGPDPEEARKYILGNVGPYFSEHYMEFGSAKVAPKVATKVEPKVATKVETEAGAPSSPTELKDLVRDGILGAKAKGGLKSVKDVFSFTLDQIENNSRALKHQPAGNQKKYHALLSNMRAVVDKARPSASALDMYRNVCNVMSGTIRLAPNVMEEWSDAMMAARDCLKSAK